MDSVEEIKERLSIDEVVGNYVQLKQAGHNFKGLCPFHDEKTPSFTVSPEKGIYHCFGCNEGGDIFTFVEKMDGLDFRGALELLAQKAGVDLPDHHGNDQQKQHKQRLKEALTAAAQYYHICLSKSESARKYVESQRGFSRETIKEFKIGYAPSAGSGLADSQHLSRFLKNREFSDQELIDAGLARRRQDGLQDVFRGRIMVPFFDTSGQVIGFTGRVLSQDDLPKYLNTPQTRLFDKSRFVFGLYQAKEAIRSSGHAIVVEGNLDVISSYQAGIKQTVAISGTALTVQQLKQLSRFSRDIVLAFDADQAGLKATERALPLANETEVALHIVNLPLGKDPDDVIRQDPEEWQRMLDERVYVMDWLLSMLSNLYDVSSAQGKKQLTDRAAGAIKAIRDPVEKEHYIQKLADLVSIAPAAISQKITSLESSQTTKPAKKPAAGVAVVKHDETDTVVDALLSLAVTYPDTRTALNETTIDSLAEPALSIAKYLSQNESDIAIDNLPSELLASANYVKILLLRGEEEYSDWAPLDRQVEAFSLAHRLNDLHKKRQKQTLSHRIAAAEAADNYDLRQDLLKEFNKLNQ